MYKLDRFRFIYSRGYWDAISNHNAFMAELAQKLNITDVKGWKHLTKRSLVKHGGQTLLRKHDGSLSKLLTTLCPEYKTMCKDFVQSVMNDMKLSKVEDITTIPLKYQKEIP